MRFGMDTAEVRLSPEAQASKEVSQRAIAKLKEKEAELKTQKEILKSNLLQDEDYADLDSNAKSLTHNAKKRREELLQEESFKPMVAMIDELSQEVKDLRLTVSENLETFHQATQLSFIEGLDGKKYRIKRRYSAGSR